MTDPLAHIEPARLQYLEQSFHDLLGGSTDSRVGRRRHDILLWLHQRLFIEGEPVTAVRMELNRMLRRTRLFAVSSGKGGVGKTTVSVNLAVAFAQQGHRTLLFDGDLGMANVHIFSGINPSHTLLDVVERRAALDEILLPGPAGIQVMCGASGVSRLADISAPVIEALGRELMRVASGFDVLVMDTGAGVANSVMHFLGMAQDVIVVATPNLAATLDAYGIIKLAREYRIAGRMNLLINMADSEEQAARVAERVVGCARRFLDHAPASLGHLVRDQAVEHANQSRRPLVIAHPEHFNARRFGELAAKLMGATTDEHIEPQPIDQQIAAA